MRGITWLGVGLLGLAASAHAQPSAAPDMPGKLVIRPRPITSVTALPVVPDMPGKLVIRPKGWPVPGGGTPSAVGPLASVLVGAPPAATPPAATPVDNPEDGRIRLETWDVVFLRGMKAGHFHVVVRDYQRDGKPLVYATKMSRLTVARFGQPADLWGEEATMETPAGEVLTTRFTQGLGRNQELTLEGTVTGKSLAVQIKGALNDSVTVPFPEGVVGVAGEAGLFAAKKPKPGDTFEYKGYLPLINQVVTYTAAAKNEEDLAVYEGQKPRRVLRIAMSAAPVLKYKHPPATVWVDAVTFEPVRLDTNVPSLGGKVTVLRTTKEYATRPAAQIPELNEVQSIVLDRAVPNVHQLDRLQLRMTLGDDLKPADAVAQDARQTLTNIDPTANAFDLTLTARRAPVAVPANTPADPGAEFMGASFFIDWRNDATKRNAQAAVAGLPAGATAWQKAQAVERWVHTNMKAAEFSQAMATCSKVSTDLSGDCTEYAMLGAGMCRAVGVPSRTALGLVYAAGRDGKPTLAYHMWFEVYADGQWLALDGTLGRGSVGAGHIKITDTSWHEEQSFAPLLPVLSVLGATPKVSVR